MTQTVELDITALAGLGDGIGHWQEKTVFVPFALPGERVRAILSADPKDQRAELLEILIPSPERGIPPCRHFGVCGGCELQHLSSDAYARFKRGIALQVAERLGVAERVMPLVTVPLHSRRRAEVKVTVQKGEVSLGYYAARSHRIIDLHECPIVDSHIEGAFAAWREAIEKLKTPGNIKAIHFTALENGLDVILQVTSRSKPQDREKLIAFAATQPILRLQEHVGGAGDYDALGRRQPVMIYFAGVAIELPTGAFLQATLPSQQALQALVAAGCEGGRRIIDLYCGCGTFSFPLAQAGYEVSAVEGNPEMVNAAANAARKAGLTGVQFSARDLYKTPIPSAELARYDTAVINPPRNGALPQVQELAKAGVRRIVMVSCNPATFERDAKHLLEHGYVLDSLTPVDQFLWSHHLEVVGIFTAKQESPSQTV